MPFFRRCDWLAFGLTTLVVFVGYWLTLAPDLTLEDSGEMAVASQYAGVPHSPGYPVWTLYTWLFTHVLLFDNIAWRVALASAVAGALACGLMALVVSRGTERLLANNAAWAALEERWRNAMGLTSALVAGALMGFSGFMWSQAVIVEVYTLSILSLMAVIACLFRWIHVPQQRRYLYCAWFLFGICLSNHQSLIVAVLAIELCVALADPPLGRDLFLGNVLCYALGLVATAQGWIGLLQGNGPLLVFYHSVGLGSLMALVWLALKTRGLGRQFGRGLGCAAAFAGGAAFYLWLPLASMANPPMNWAYPRTVSGFVHALTRGQYDRVHPVTDVGHYVQQLWQLAQGAVDEFNLLYLLIGLLPLVWLRRLAARPRAWVLGGLGFYLTLGPLLLMLLNPGTDRGSQTLVRVFFAASHVPVAMAIGWGLALAVGWLLTHQTWSRRGALITLAVALVWGVFDVASAWRATDLPLTRGTALFGLALTIVVSGLVLWVRAATPNQDASSPHPSPPLQRRAGVSPASGLANASHSSASPTWAGETPALQVGVEESRRFMDWHFALRLRPQLAWGALLGALCLMPMHSVLSHWWTNEQRGHLFGFWFGHDMFTPPFKGKDGQLIYSRAEREQARQGPEGRFVYPELSRDAVLFGGTDPGRFCPTYMIFCESFLKPELRRDPAFDRRDVYIITQNALADPHYLEYIRAHYQRSAQRDPYFLSQLLRGSKEEELNLHTNVLARLALPLDRALTNLGARIERQRRANGLYPPKELQLPTEADLSRCMNDYLRDWQARAQRNQLKPGEEVRVAGGQAQLSGQVAVMGINALLTHEIFRKNSEHEFFVEESAPLDWMYPHLTPFGIIMKLNREPLAELGLELVERDRRFWRDYMCRLIGDWVRPETNIAEICTFAEQVHLRRNLSHYAGDMKFLRDEQAQKSFSKLRTAIAGLYDWRFRQATGQLQQITQQLSQAGLTAEQVESLRAEQRRLSAEQMRMFQEAEFASKQAYALCPFNAEAFQRLVNLLLATGHVREALAVAETSQKLDPGNAFYTNVAEQLRQATRRS